MPDVENPATGWDRFLRNITCRLSSSSSKADPDTKNYPRFTIIIKYTGSKTVSIPWDDNFARLLWEGKFRLVAVIGTKKESTAEMKYRTSNTYSPGRTVTLAPGEETRSTLDFSLLPGRYAKNLFTNRGKVSFRLYGVFRNNETQPREISNTLTIDIH